MDAADMQPLDAFEPIPAGGIGGPSPRHIRSDLRLIAQAARKGWLDDATPEKMDRLLAFISAAIDSGNVRVLFAAASAMLAIEEAGLRLCLRDLKAKATARVRPVGVALLNMRQ